jgi:hypothetical protein
MDTGAALLYPLARKVNPFDFAAVNPTAHTPARIFSSSSINFFDFSPLHRAVYRRVETARERCEDWR